MWVDPDVRQQGCGRALSEAVIAWARERTLVDIVLWVTEGNKAAIALYERLGFALTGRRDQHPAHARASRSWKWSGRCERDGAPALAHHATAARARPDARWLAA